MTEPLTREEIDTYLRTWKWSRARVVADTTPTKLDIAQQLLAALDALEAERTAHAELVARLERAEAAVSAADRMAAMFATPSDYALVERYRILRAALDAEATS